MFSTTFDFKDINKLRANSSKVAEDFGRDHYPEGWNKSRTDPEKLLSVFRPLTLKKGYTLRSYIWQDSIGGFGIVWAMPIGSNYPKPSECISRIDHTFMLSVIREDLIHEDLPKPPDALLDIMQAIEGDRTEWSYLCASIFAREAAEFGAWWHGLRWRTHKILNSEPLESEEHYNDNDSMSLLPEYPRSWKWLVPKPEEWRPTVDVDTDKKRITVSFYSSTNFIGEGGGAIYHHEDSFNAGSYSFNTKREIVAKGPGGYIF